MLQARFFDHLHADGTYKVCYQGYPLLVIGVTDKARVFHPCRIALCKTETWEDYRFLFKSLQVAVETITKERFSSSTLVADCADAITKGFNDVFGESTNRVFCYFHVKQAYEKYTHTHTQKHT